MIRIGILFLVLAVATTRAEAQFYGGYGGIWGMFSPENGSATINAIHQRNLQAGQAAYASRPTNLTAPRVNVRDDAGLAQFQSYDIATQQAIEQRLSRRRLTPLSQPSAPPATASAPAAAPAPSVPMTVSLGNFFDRYGSFVWPADAPTSPDLLAMRAASDRAVATVRKEYDARGIASAAAAADARILLLEYGRPALEQIRSTSTPAIADMFHVFLLSLYRNLENAATAQGAPRGN